jgi:hypothetical protein
MGAVSSIGYEWMRAADGFLTAGYAAVLTTGGATLVLCKISHNLTNGDIKYEPMEYNQLRTITEDGKVTNV